MSKEEAKHFVKKAQKLSNADEMVYMFDQENMQEMIRNAELEEATEKGIKQGSAATTIAIVKNMLDIKIDLQTISKVKGLTIKEIEYLKNK